MRFFWGGGTLLSHNDRGLGTTQHSQKEFDSSQTGISNKQAFLSLRETKGTDETTSLVTLLAELRLGKGSTEIDNLQSETSNSEKLPLPLVEGVLAVSLLV